MKKIALVVMFSFAVLIFAGCRNATLGTNNGVGSNSSRVASSDSKNMSSASSSIGSSSSNTSNELDTQGNIGNYYIIIESYSFSKNDKGNKVIIIKYKFTNNSEKETSFLDAITDTVFQNNVQLDFTDFDVTNNEEQDFLNSMKKVQKGGTLEIASGFVLNDNQSSVSVEVSTDNSDVKIVKLFNISNTSSPLTSSTSGANAQNNLSDYNVIIESYSFSKNDKGNKVIIIKYKFTNNSEEETSFMDAITDTVFQNKVQLDFTDFDVNNSEEQDFLNLMKKVQKGGTLEVASGYVLNDSQSPVSVEVSADNSNIKITKTFNIS